MDYFVMKIDDFPLKGMRNHIYFSAVAQNSVNFILEWTLLSEDVIKVVCMYQISDDGVKKKDIKSTCFANRQPCCCKNR